jgi:hypothetical protein
VTVEQILACHRAAPELGDVMAWLGIGIWQDDRKLLAAYSGNTRPRMKLLTAKGVAKITPAIAAQSVVVILKSASASGRCCSSSVTNVTLLFRPMSSEYEQYVIPRSQAST